MTLDNVPQLAQNQTLWERLAHSANALVQVYALEEQSSKCLFENSNQNSKQKNSKDHTQLTENN